MGPISALGRSFGTAALTLILSIPLTGADTSKRKVFCKTAENANSCYWTHGRLTAGSGNPAVRLWKVGTKRLLGIYSGPGVDRYGRDNEDPELPANLRHKFKPGENWVFADFEVCALEPEKPGAMQAVCIESAKNIVVEK